MPVPVSHPTPPPGADEPAGTASVRAHLDALFETAPLAVAIFDESRSLLRASRHFFELTGMDPARTLGTSIFDAFPNALADLSEAIDRVALGEPPVTTQTLFQMRAGTRAIELTFTATDELTGVRGILCTAVDATQREALRERLARTIAELESIFDVIPDIVRVVDTDGNIVRSNALALRESGGTPTTLSALWTLEAPRRLDGTSIFLHEHPAARALRGETVRGEELRVRRGMDGRAAIVEINANPLRDAGGHPIGAVMVERDVTDRARLKLELEEQVRRAESLYERVSTEAERLERMVESRTQELLALQETRARERRLAAVGQLAAGVMHDVNNALNPIVAAAYLLERHAEDPRAVRDYAGRIARAAETGAATAARVGRFIRQEPDPASTAKAPVHLGELCDEVLQMTRPLWAERVKGGVIRLVCDYADEALTRGIAGEIREALLNLVHNALDAMPDGGELGVTTRAVNGAAVLEVRDTGIGMTDEVRERAFEPFFSTKGQAGSGLGLSEVYGVMKRHRGRVELESTPGQGTTVRLVFPHAAAMAAAPTPPSVPTRAPVRVLLVEDNMDGREFMQALLESDGHAVDSVGYVREALLRLERAGRDAPSPYDVVVTDVGLPDGSGWELVAAVRARWPQVRVGVVTGWEVRASESATADFTLRKPIHTQEFLALVSGAAPPPTPARGFSTIIEER